MTKLMVADQRRARDFVRSKARPLEQALYGFHLERAGPEGVLAALAGFQNTDGGFGHGLEPDLALPGSSVICTTRSVQMLAEVGAPANHPLVAGGIRYLLATYDHPNRVWEIVPRSANSFPHAGWWHYDVPGLRDPAPAARWLVASDVVLGRGVPGGVGTGEAGVAGDPDCPNAQDAECIRAVGVGVSKPRTVAYTMSQMQQRDGDDGPAAGLAPQPGLHGADAAKGNEPWLTHE